MAKYKEISVNAKFVKNLGNYQSFTAEAGATLVLEDGDNIKSVYDVAWDTVGDQISEQLKMFEEDTKGGVKKGLK
jgi:ribosomal protein S4E